MLGSGEAAAPVIPLKTCGRRKRKFTCEISVFAFETL
jgi:hypothetical protein